ncbi:MAG TPA: hypothetical protein ENI11_04810 [Actinobacteria bacterium]|nr:hypothetical protein [Actinomycetota bacterium]
MNSFVRKSVVIGILAGLVLLVFFAMTLTLANSLDHVVEQFESLWFWILPLVVGFSVQVGLYSYMRFKIHEMANSAAAKELAAAGGISTGSMIACCAHHLVNVLPILGLSAFFVFLAQYQVAFILVGIVSNAIGILFMLEILGKNGLYTPGGVPERYLSFDLRNFRLMSTVVGSVIVLFAFFWTYNSGFSGDIKNELSTPTLDQQPAGSKSLQPQTSEEGNLSIQVTPVSVSPGQPVLFGISFTTHQDDLDFDLSQQATLFDDRGDSYKPVSWDGGSGGHHLSGKIEFTPLPAGTKQIRLVLYDLYGVEERVFKWTL